MNGLFQEKREAGRQAQGGMRLWESRDAEQEADRVGIQFARSEDVMRDMEEAYGADFSNIRIHHDAEADSRVRSVGRDAVAQGNDVYFGRGIFESPEPDAKALVGHELAHTMQQGEAGPQAQSAMTQTAVPAAAQGGRLGSWFKGLFNRKEKKSAPARELTPAEEYRQQVKGIEPEDWNKKAEVLLEGIARHGSINFRASTENNQALGIQNEELLDAIMESFYEIIGTNGPNEAGRAAFVNAYSDIQNNAIRSYRLHYAEGIRKGMSESEAASYAGQYARAENNVYAEVQSNLNPMTVGDSGVVNTWFTEEGGAEALGGNPTREEADLLARFGSVKGVQTGYGDLQRSRDLLKIREEEAALSGPAAGSAPAESPAPVESPVPVASPAPAASAAPAGVSHLLDALEPSQMVPDFSESLVPPADFPFLEATSEKQSSYNSHFVPIKGSPMVSTSMEETPASNIPLLEAFSAAESLPRTNIRLTDDLSWADIAPMQIPQIPRTQVNNIRAKDTPMLKKPNFIQRMLKHF